MYTVWYRLNGEKCCIQCGVNSGYAWRVFTAHIVYFGWLEFVRENAEK